MPTITIEPDSRFDFNVAKSGQFLLVRYSDENIFLASDHFRASGVQTGDAINVSEFDGMRFENQGTEAARVEYQISDLPISTNATQNITIQRIIEPIQFEASVRVKDGLKVDIIAASRLASLNDQTIQPGQTVKLSSNTQGRKQTAIQVISDNVTLLRVGGAGVGASCGAILKGSVNALASTVIDSGADVYAHNASHLVAKVSVTEVLA